MSDFDTFRGELAQTGGAADRARGEARAAHLRATAASGDEQAKAQAAAAQARADAADRAHQEVLSRFDGFTDPRRNIGLLSDDSPILLLPLRIETRFGTTIDDQAGQERRELWVRIYPDACSINSFDSELSTAEVAAGTRFWQQFWRAGGVDADRRAAWRNLAGAYGVGRAGWIVKAFAPVDPSAEPTRPDGGVILVVSATTLPAAALRAQLGTYWTALWLAGEDAGKRATAWNQLVSDLGSAAAAQRAVEQFRPFNIDDPVPSAPPGLTRATTALSLAWLQLPDMPGEERLGWRQAPTARALPERFVVIGYTGAGVAFEAVTGPVTTPLVLGPDPAAPPEQQIVPTPDGDLQVPDQLAWMFDFDAAVTAGMGVRVPLTEDQAGTGFERIVVVGLRMQADADQGRQEVEQLIAGHTYSRSGFEIVRQGVPTNNADGEPSAWSRRDDPDLAYDDVFGSEKFDVRTDPLEKRDGQVLAEALGLDPVAVQHVRGADGRDSIEARALNTTLAPGTLNYLTGTMMQPVFDGWVDELSWYFRGYVSGRGPVPAVRIAIQPYGVIVSSAFSRMAWLRPGEGEVALRVPHLAFLQRLDAVLRALDPYWRSRLAGVSRVGDGADPHETLLGAVGLHPNSAEFHIRLGKSMDELVSRGALMLINVIAIITASEQRADAAAFLRSFGYAGQDPELLDLFFRSNQSNLNGSLVEDVPLSEVLPLAASTTDNRNYLEWLADTAQVSLDAVRRQEGFVDDTPPRSLLYLMAQFALTRGYYDAGYRLRASSGLFTTEVLQSVLREPTSVHLVQATQVSDSPWRHLYDNDARLTGSADLTVAEHLTAVLPTRPDYAVDLADQIHALEQLIGTPTARLERILVEHIDTLAYRYDAWRLGTVTWQLERMRQGAEGGGRGLYVGAYGWLEDVRPKPRSVPAPPLPPDVAKSFADGPPLVVDPTNQGHLHAPSLNQAVTAAILRAGELSTRSATSPGPFSVNLSSERVRTATALLDGVRTGQSLGALLGYRFERALHDASGTFVELDSLVFAFRRAFPLTADHLTSTRTTAEDPPPPTTEAIEARNVVDGLALVKRTATSPSYPYAADLPGLSGVALSTVEKAVADLVGIFDALADLVVAEGVHQTAQSNPDRAAAHVDIQGDFTAPPEPTVIQTPNRGLALTCRVGIELDPTAAAGAGAPPRVIAQPALNAWLADSLPPMADVACRVTWSVGGGPASDTVVTLADLGLAPLDALELVSDDNGSALQELQDRVRHFVDTTRSPRPDALVTIDYQDAPAGKLSIFVASALVRRLRGLTLRSRPLRAGDVTPPSSGGSNDAVPHVVDPARLSTVSSRLNDLLTDVNLAIAAAEPLLADPVANRAALLSGIDARLATVADLLVRTAAFGGARIGWHALYEWRDERFSTLVRRVDELLDRWATRLAECAGALVAEQDPSATVEQRLGLLRAAEGQVSTTLAPEVDDPVLLRPSVVAKQTAFTAKRDAIRTSAVEAPQPGLADRLNRCQAVLPISDFQVEPLSFTDVADSIVAYWTDLQAMLTSAQADLTDRHDKAVAALTAHGASVEPEVQLGALQSGAEAVFGEGFTLIPTFSVPAASAAEQTQAYAHFTSGALLAHAGTVLGVDNPLDTWLYGLARVRPKLRLVEDTVMLWDAHSLGASALAALQLPHKVGAPWLALDFDQADTPDSERMTYVCLVPAGFDPAGPRCGVLVDDWTETIPAVPVDEPGPQQTTGIAFNFDRPSQEPPQAMLLLTPAQWNGAWAWPDVVDGIIDTFDLARLRAVEPDQLDDGPLGQFLPATVAATTTSGLLLTANYVLANVQATIARSADG